jgi:hypothetical protein
MQDQNRGLYCGSIHFIIHKHGRLLGQQLLLTHFHRRTVLFSAMKNMMCKNENQKNK